MSYFNCPVCSEAIHTAAPPNRMDGSTIKCPACNSAVAIFSEIGKPTLTLPVCDHCDEPIRNEKYVHLDSPDARGAYCERCVPAGVEKVTGLALPEFVRQSKLNSLQDHRRTMQGIEQRIGPEEFSRRSDRLLRDAMA